MSELHLRTVLPWNIIINALKTPLRNTNSIWLPSCKCNKIIKNKKSEFILEHHQYLQNQICQKENCEYDTMKYFGRGLSDKLDYPPKIHSLGINENDLRYFFSKFLETVDDFAKTKKIYMENMNSEFIRIKNEYKNSNSITFHLDENFYVPDIHGFVNKFKRHKEHNFDLSLDEIDIEIELNFILDSIIKSNVHILLYLINNGICLHNFYNVRTQYVMLGYGYLFALALQNYIIISSHILCNKKFNYETLGNDSWKKYYFDYPLLEKFKDHFSNNDLQNLKHKEKVEYIIINKDNSVLKYLFDIMVNIYILEQKQNTNNNFEKEINYVLKNIFFLDVYD
jgi:hypothetical protein